MGEGLSRSSHPIRLGLRLLPGTRAAADEVIVAAGDGLLDSYSLVAWAILFLAAP